MSRHLFAKVLCVAVVLVTLASSSSAGAALDNDGLSRLLDYPTVCHEPGDWPYGEGTAGVATGEAIELHPRYCSRLRSSANPDEHRWGPRRVYRRAAAWLVLLHEYAHTLGYGHGVYGPGDPLTTPHADCVAVELMPGYLARAGVPSERHATILEHAAAMARRFCPTPEV